MLDQPESDRAMSDPVSSEYGHLSDEDLWRELVRRGAALRVGFCYPAMASEDAATALIHEHGYEYGPFQFLELGHRLSEPPQWPMFAAVPDKFRRTGAADA